MLKPFRAKRIYLFSTLDFQFAGATAISSQITFTRASTGSYYNSAGVLSSAAINEARLDYNPSTLAAQGLLIEEARTNLLLQSSAFDTASWGKSNSTVTANAIASPDGTVNADKLVENTATSEHYARQSFVGLTASANYTTSIYFKAGERTAGQIRILDTDSVTNGYYVNFNLTTVTVTPVSVGTGTVLAGSIVNAGNGWYRIVVTGAITGTKYTLDAFIQNPAGTQSYTGDGTSGFYIWGAQLEAGTFPTSYIPTTTTALTRAADVASVNTLSPWYNSVEGTLYAEVVYLGQLIGTAAETNTIQLSDGTSANRITLRTVRDPTNPQLDAIVTTATVTQMDTTGFSPGVVGTTYKRALAYALNNAQHCVNGTLDGATDTSITVPTGINVLTLPTASCALYARRITYYPTRLSNAQLQAITT